MIIFVVMKAQYQHIPTKRNDALSVERFDKNNACHHQGLHFHHNYEIVFIKNGKGRIFINDTCQEYENGAILFLSPCLPHYSFTNAQFEDNFEIVIHFDEAFIENRLKPIPEFLSLIPFIHQSKKVLVYDSIFKEKQTAIFEEIVNQNPLEQLISFFRILSRLASSSNYHYLLNKPFNDSRIQHKQVENIFNFINENYQQSISTKDIAKHLNLTTNSFCKVFKKLTHKTFITYLNEYRIHRASNLLENTNDTISEIAFQCGFENLSYFSKMFYRVKNNKPIDYKRLLEKGKKFDC